MKIKYSLILLIISIKVGNSFAQTKVDIVPTSPEASALTKMVNYPVNLNTGVPEIAIPLYTIKSDGLELPIALRYHAGGFRINEQSTNVGLGWSLGEIQITRSVNGLDDFKYGSGYLANTRVKTFANCFNCSYDFSDAGTFPGRSTLELALGDIDGMPDKFNYKLLNKSGSFYFMKSSNGESYSIVPVPYDNIHIQYVNNSFIITDTDGSTYYFGLPGPINPNNPASDGREITRFQEISWDYTYRISAWKCLKIENYKKITALNFSYNKKAENRISTFTENIEYYNNPNPSTLASAFNLNNQQFPAGTDNYQKLLMQTGFHLLSSPKYMVNSASGSAFHLPYVGPGPGNSAQVVDRVFLSTISPRNVSIVDGLSLSQISFRGGQVDFAESSEKLASITVHDANYNEVKKIEFLSNYKEPEDIYSARDINGMNYQGTLYLDGLQMKANGQTFEEYGFNYFEKTCFGNHLNGSDAWGHYNPSTSQVYWGNTSSPVSKIPQQSITQNFHFNTNNAPISGLVFNIGNPSSTELPKEDDVKRGVLRRIVYPSGGYSDFDFESNLYEQPASDNMGNSRVVMRGGGLRIKAINFYDRLQKFQGQKYYRYGELEDGIGQTIHTPPRTFVNGSLKYDGFSYTQNILYVKNIDMVPFPTGSNAVWNKETKTTYMPCASLNYAVNGAPIFYTKVTEYNNDLGRQTGKKVFTYYEPLTFDFSVSTAPMLHDTNIPYLSPDGFLGALKSVEDFKYNNGTYQLIHSKENTYEKYELPNQITVASSFLNNIYRRTSGSFPSSFNEYSGTGWHNTSLPVEGNFSGAVYGIPVGKLLLKSEIEKWHEDAQVLQASTSYNYGRLPYMQPTSMTTVNSRGETTVKTMKYAYDFSGGIYDQMKLPAINMISFPVEEILAKNDVQISKTFTNYDVTNVGFGFIAPTSIQTSIKGTIPVTELTFDRYDQYGNILQTTAKGGLVRSYLWGYNYTYPIAEFTGINYTTATSGITVAALQSITDETQLKSNLSALRAAHPSAMVSSYIYKPLVGISVQTMPNGLDKNYEYDSYGRLSAIKDHEKNIISKYSYKLPEFNPALDYTYVNVPILASVSSFCTPDMVRLTDFVYQGGSQSSYESIENYLFSGSALPSGVISDTLPCIAVSQLSQIKLDVFMQSHRAIPRSLYLDLIQDKSVVKSHKFPEDGAGQKNFYLAPGQYKVSFRQAAIDGGVIIKFYVNRSVGSGFWIKHNENILLEPGISYSINATNTF